MTINPGSEITRRRFLASGSLAAAVAFLAPRHLFAGADGLVEKARKEAAAATITVQPLRGNVSVLMGAGGNIAVLPGRDGKLLIDAGYAGARPQISDALARISSDPIKHLINSHWHFDHTDGNEWLHSAGAAILAHENTRKHLSTATRVRDGTLRFHLRPPAQFPLRSLKMSTRCTSTALPWPSSITPAHTDSDISVHATDADIFHAGDTFWNGSYPFIDYSTGGSIDGQIRAAQANLEKVTEKMIVIPGHGPVGGKTELTLFHDVLVDMRDKVAPLKKQGRSLADVVAAKPGARYDAEWGKSFMSPSAFVGLVYQGV